MEDRPTPRHGRPAAYQGGDTAGSEAARWFLGAVFGSATDDGSATRSRDAPSLVDMTHAPRRAPSPMVAPGRGASLATTHFEVAHGRGDPRATPPFDVTRGRKHARITCPTTNQRVPSPSSTMHAITRGAAATGTAGRATIGAAQVQGGRTSRFMISGSARPVAAALLLLLVVGCTPVVLARATNGAASTNVPLAFAGNNYVTPMGALQALDPTVCRQVLDMKMARTLPPALAGTLTSCVACGHAWRRALLCLRACVLREAR